VAQDLEEGVATEAAAVARLTGEQHEVLAAGGVVWRRRHDGDVEVLLVHRPKYDDWSFPKGKLDPGEGFEDAALREVEEETGLRCRLGDGLKSAEYRDHHGRSKLVRYWAMEPLGGEFHPTSEVDEVRWVSPADARRVLSYDHDREVLGALEV
jgi:8-oxo-dGTP diphosphatase